MARTTVKLTLSHCALTSRSNYCIQGIRFIVHIPFSVHLLSLPLPGALEIVE